MTDNNICTWVGASGTPYQYWFNPMATAHKYEAGNYIFAHWNGQGWVADYIGETESLGDRCCGLHEKWDRALRCGATHIHAHTTPGDRARRLAEERDLIARFRPPCNDQ